LWDLLRFKWLVIARDGYSELEIDSEYFQYLIGMSEIEDDEELFAEMTAEAHIRL